MLVGSGGHGRGRRAAGVVIAGDECLGFLYLGDGLAVYRANWPGASPGDILAAVVTDWFFGIPAVRVAEARAAAPAPTWISFIAGGTPGWAPYASPAEGQPCSPTRSPKPETRPVTSEPCGTASDNNSGPRRSW
jgi:hypothetical protein